MKSVVSALTKFVAAAMVIGTTTAHAAEIKVIASAAVKEVVLDLIPAFEKSSGHKVTTIWAGTEAITKRIKDRKSTRLNSSHIQKSRMPSSA